MSIKPPTAKGYRDAPIELVRATCLQVATVLGDLMDELVIVGGFVPTLLVDQENLGEGVDAHVGTLDLDVGMSLAIFDDEHYKAITERLRGAGFEADVNENGNPVFQRWLHQEYRTITVDFLIPPSLDTDRGGRIRKLEKDFGAIIAPGLELAFRDFETVEISGTTLKGEKAVRSVKVCGAGAYVVLKALTFRNRGENKDAYDLFYLIRNYGSGVEDVAERFRLLLPNDECETCLGILREDFAETDSVGVRRVAAFMLGEGMTDDALQAEVVGYIDSFLESVKVA
ncbi:MAG: hypothetical protein AB7V18_08335 [Pyrinomonadaceae bacterium]